MSKIGKQPIKIPAGVEVVLEAGGVSVKGSKGSLTRKFPRPIELSKEGDIITVSITRADRQARALHGTVRATLANMITGVDKGWSKQMELIGAGYRAEVRGDSLVLTVGYINPVEIKAPAGIAFKVEKNIVTIDGIDKEVVGETAAKIRKVRPPEPYQGKGIRYVGEVIKKKPGKAAKAGEGA